MAKIYDDEELRRALFTYEETDNYSETARRLGLARSTVRYQVEQAIRRNIAASAVPESVYDELPQGMEVSKVSTHFSDKDADGKRTNVWVQMKPQIHAPSLEAIHETMKAYDGLFVPRDREPLTEIDTLSFYPVPDLHLGMLAWRKETGEAYDIDIATRIAREKSAALMLRTPPSGIGIIVVLGDFFHADDNSAATPQHGNPLDVDSRHQKVFHRGVEIVLDMIELARGKHKHIIVRVLPGNHDPISSHALGDALYWAYHNCPEVTVDIDPSGFFAYQFGKTMIAAHHGHEVKPAEFSGVMAAYWPEIWGDTTHRYGLMGHLHRHMKIPTDENRGAEVEVLQSPAAKDAWNRGMGHASGRSLSAMVYRYDGGEDCRFIEHIREGDLK